jgi:hypothetical protein
LRFRNQIPFFALNKEAGEVVFTLRMAYQAINTKLEPNPPGSYYNDISDLVSDIVRERNLQHDRGRAERFRKQQVHRRELADAREAAKTLLQMQKAKPKARRVLILFHGQGIRLTYIHF